MKKDSILLSLIVFFTLFPPDVLDTIARTLTFAVLQENPNAYKGTTVDPGGRIIGSRVGQDDLRILARELLSVSWCIRFRVAKGLRENGRE